MLHANTSLLLFQIAHGRLSRRPDLFVAVRAETLEGADRRRRGGEAERFHGGDAQPRRFAAEQLATRLGELDQRLHRIGAADSSQRQHQLLLDGFVFLFSHCDHERHRERTRLAAAHAERRLNPDLGGLVLERPPQRLGGRARSGLRERERSGLVYRRFSAIEYWRSRASSPIDCSARTIPATIANACSRRFARMAVSSWRLSTASKSGTCGPVGLRCSSATRSVDERVAATAGANAAGPSSCRSAGTSPAGGGGGGGGIGAAPCETWGATGSAGNDAWTVTLMRCAPAVRSRVGTSSSPG